ncbi:MAG: FtsZ/tubulin family protein [Planctomycetota bacterium]|jgi:cell division GTPase FtsZ
MAASKKKRTKAAGTAKKTAARAAGGSRKKKTKRGTAGGRRPRTRATETRAASARLNESVPALALEGHTPQDAGTAALSGEPQGSMRFGLVGIGRCGSRMIEALRRLGYRRCMAMHTHPAAWEECALPEHEKLLLECGPRGAGKDLERGRSAVETHRESIAGALERVLAGQVDQVIVALGCGGGTGGGGIAPLLELLRSRAEPLGLSEPGHQIGCLCTLPTSAESSAPQVAANAAKVFGELTAMAASGRLSPLLVVDNDRVNRMYPELTVARFLPTINETTAGLFDIFNRLSALGSGASSFGSRAYRDLLRMGGCTVMGLATLDPAADEAALAGRVLAQVPGTLLADGFQMETARSVGVLAVAGGGILTASLRNRIEGALKTIEGITGKARFCASILEDDRPGLRLYTMMGGLGAPAERMARLKSAA